MSDDLTARLNARAEEFRSGFDEAFTLLEEASLKALADGVIDGISAASAKILAGEDGDRSAAAIERLENLACRFWSIVEHQHAMTVHLKPDADGKPRWHRPDGTVMSAREHEEYFRALHGWRPNISRFQRIVDALRALASFGGYRAR